MKRIVPLLLSVFLAMAWACSSRPALEKEAFDRLPKALEKAMEEQMSMPGGAEIVSPEVMYSCDSLCIIQFKAIAKNPQAKGFSFPVRYVFLKDVVMSHAYGHPVFAERVSGCVEMTPEEIRQTKDKFLKDAEKIYSYFASTASLISPEDL